MFKRLGGREVCGPCFLQHRDPARVGESKENSEESLPLGRGELKQPIREYPGSSPEKYCRVEDAFSTLGVARSDSPPGRCVQAGGVGSPPWQVSRAPRGGAESPEPQSCSPGQWTSGAAAAFGTQALTPWSKQRKCRARSGPPEHSNSGPGSGSFQRGGAEGGAQAANQQGRRFAWPSGSCSPLAPPLLCRRHALVQKGQVSES